MSAALATLATSIVSSGERNVKTPPPIAAGGGIEVSGIYLKGKSGVYLMVQARGLGTLFPEGDAGAVSLVPFCLADGAQEAPEVPLRCIARGRFDIIGTLPKPSLPPGYSRQNGIILACMSLGVGQESVTKEAA